MHKHTLFVCQSCHCSAEKRSDDRPADGALLLDQINTLASATLPSDNLDSLLVLPRFRRWDEPMRDRTVRLVGVGKARS